MPKTYDMGDQTTAQALHAPSPLIVHVVTTELKIYLTPVLLRHLHPHQPVLEQPSDNGGVHGALGVHLSNPRCDDVLREL